MSLICPKCRHLANEEDRYCSNCGAPLNEEKQENVQEEEVIDLSRIFEMSDSVKYSSIDEIFTVIPPDKEKINDKEKDVIEQKEYLTSTFERTNRYGIPEEESLKEQIKELLEKEDQARFEPEIVHDKDNNTTNMEKNFWKNPDDNKINSQKNSMTEDNINKEINLTLEDKQDLLNNQPISEENLEEETSGQEIYNFFIQLRDGCKKALVKGVEVFDKIAYMINHLSRNILKKLSLPNSNERMAGLILYAALTILPLLLFIRSFSSVASRGQVIIAYFIMIFLGVMIGAYRFICLLGGSFALGRVVPVIKFKQEKILLISIFISFLEAFFYLFNKDLYGFSNSLITGQLFTSHPILFFFLLLVQVFFLYSMTIDEIKKSKQKKALLSILGGVFLTTMLLHFIGITISQLLIKGLLPDVF